jgi:hypothetical protein
MQYRLGFHDDTYDSNRAADVHLIYCLTKRFLQHLN